MTSEPITTITVPRYALTQTPEEPRGFYAYHIACAGPVRQWTVRKRYSELHALRDALLAAQPAADPGTPFPPKDGVGAWLGLLGGADERAEKRARALEEWLRAVVSASDPRWRRSDAWLDFFGLPRAGTGGAAQDPGASPVLDARAWLDELDALRVTAGDVRNLAAKRNATGTPRGEALQAGFDGKRLHSSLSSGLSRLEASLKADERDRSAALSRMELERRWDMLERLRTDRDDLGKMLAQPMTGRGGGGSETPPPGAAPSSGNAGTIGSGGAPSERTSLLGAAANPRSNRRFGNSTFVPQTLETDETRQLDNGGLVQLQKQQMEAQDGALDQLTDVVRRQKQIAGLISDELDHQNELLDELDAGVDRTGDRMKRAGKQLDKVLKG
ncbi:hypothetical protein DFJ74DRAFT_634358 [Hyaloraphidium curvatum]|nr:hypothetical protein DFJ74DRAFT_634358 [Hyaloraphidium curvatum]